MYLEQMPDFKYSDPLLLYVEYHAVMRFYANGLDAPMEERYGDVAAQMREVEMDVILSGDSSLTNRALEMLRAGKFDTKPPLFALQAVHRFLDTDGNILPDFGGDDEVIETAKPVATPVRNTNAEIQKKKRDQKGIASELYQRKRLGDDAVPKALYAEARQRVDQHLNGGGTREDLIPMASQLALDNKLTEGQTDTLLNEIMLKHFDKLNHHNVIEHELLFEPTKHSKTIFYLWHKLSCKYEVGVPFPLPTNTGVAMARVSKNTWPDIIKTMRKMGIIKQISKGQRGPNSDIAARYKLLVSVSG